MSIRFRKSIKIIPGVRLNVGKRGVSISAGPRGTSVSMGARGVYGNVGLTGTGMSFRSRLDGQGANANNRRTEIEQSRQAKMQAKIDAEQHRQEALSKVSLKLQENGAIVITDAFGEEVRGRNLAILWEQNASIILTWLGEQAEKINGDSSLLEKIHEDSPYPDSLPIYEVIDFDIPPPSAPQKPKMPVRPEQRKMPKLSIFLRMFKAKRQKHIDGQLELDNQHNRAVKDWELQVSAINEKYEEEILSYSKQRNMWEERKREHDIEEERIKANFNDLLMLDLNIMESVLDRAMSLMDWPRETLVSYEIKDGGETVWLDVDFPEIEDLPQQIAAISSTGKKLNIKKKPVTQLRGEYATHIHGIIFRLTCVVFATLPKAKRVCISGYSQRLDPSTGRTKDDYLMAFRIEREKFLGIDFDHLDIVDPIEALARFEHRRKMSSTGIFKPVEPYEILED